MKRRIERVPPGLVERERRRYFDHLKNEIHGGVAGMRRRSPLGASGVHVNDHEPIPPAKTPKRPRCDVCGALASQAADFREVRNFFLLFSGTTIRRLVCLRHARRAARATCLHNALLGTWGVPGIVTTPILAWSTASILSAPERAFWTALSATPAILLAAAIFLSR